MKGSQSQWEGESEEGKKSRSVWKMYPFCMPTSTLTLMRCCPHLVWGKWIRRADERALEIPDLGVAHNNDALQLRSLFPSSFQHVEAPKHLKTAFCFHPHLFQFIIFSFFSMEKLHQSGSKFTSVLSVQIGQWKHTQRNTSGMEALQTLRRLTGIAVSFEIAEC